MKNRFLIILITICLTFHLAKTQTITELGPDNYRSIQIDWPGYQDYTKSLILIHEIYDGTLLNPNFCIGTITAKRGAIGGYNRQSSITINSSSAYNMTFASCQSITSDNVWTFKTCTYNGKKYLAVDLPYAVACFNQGYYFTGYFTSTGDGMKAIPYETNGQPVNQSILSDIMDYNGASLNQKIMRMD